MQTRVLYSDRIRWERWRWGGGAGEVGVEGLVGNLIVSGEHQDAMVISVGNEQSGSSDLALGAPDGNTLRMEEPAWKWHLSV